MEKEWRFLISKKKLHNFIYGNPPNKVSYANLLCNGLTDYSILYEEFTYQEINKDWNMVEKEGLKLKPELIVDYSKPYFAGVHITSTNLKSNNHSGKINFVATKTLINWARSAATDFCMQMLFVLSGGILEKWNKPNMVIQLMMFVWK